MGRSLLKLVREEGGTHVGVAFDQVIESFRNQLFAGYKTSAGIDPALWQQFPWAEKVSAALGFVTWPMVEFEADDALATMAHRAAQDPRVETIYLCTPDKDLCQMVQGQKVVLRDRRREQTLDQAAVVEKFGVPPHLIPDYLALVGDEADGVPGLPRFGAKGAAQLLSHYGRLENIPQTQPWTLKLRGGEQLQQVFQERYADALLYRQLTTLRTDVPLTEMVDTLAWKGPQPQLAEIAEVLEDPGLVTRAQETWDKKRNE